MSKPETREDRRNRMHATKSNSQRRVLQKKHRKPRETTALKAERAVQAKAAAVTFFAQWLEKPEVLRFAKQPKGWYSLSELVRSALDDCLENYIKYHTDKESP